MGEIDHDKMNAPAFQDFLLRHKIEFDTIDMRPSGQAIIIHVYEKTGRGDREVVRVAGGKIDGSEAQFSAFMQIAAREIYHHFLRSVSVTGVRI